MLISLLEMRYLLTDLPTEKLTKSTGKHFTDEQDPLVRYASVIIASKTVTDGIKPMNYL